MNVRKIREDLGRVKTCIQRRDYPRAVFLLCSSLKELGGQTAPMDVRGDFRNAVADICADPLYSQDNPSAQTYQPGKERELLVFFNKFYKQLVGAETTEDYESTLARKLNLDRCLNNGKRFLAEGKPREADDCFAEAQKFYKNEIAAYAIMGRAMMEAGEYVRALGHLRKGLNERPQDQDLRRLAEECLRLRAQSGR